VRAAVAAIETGTRIRSRSSEGFRERATAEA
jgi:hypothetical protein